MDNYINAKLALAVTDGGEGCYPFSLLLPANSEVKGYYVSRRAADLTTSVVFEIGPPKVREFIF